MIEIERKFLVKDQSYENEVVTSRAIKQGFLSTDPNRTVRIRVEETRGFITVKGISTDGGVSRFEWENPLSKEAAEALFKLCLPGKIEKTRHVVTVGSHLLRWMFLEETIKGLLSLRWNCRILIKPLKNQPGSGQRSQEIKNITTLP